MLLMFRCAKCDSTARRLWSKSPCLDAPNAPPKAPVCKCGEQMERDMKPPTTQVVEVLDNGAMAKRLERLADAPRLFKERVDAKNRSG